jgi:hypothetical protein
VSMISEFCQIIDAGQASNSSAFPNRSPLFVGLTTLSAEQSLNYRRAFFHCSEIEVVAMSL